MGIATSPLHSSKGYDYSLSQVLKKKNLLNSMSQEYHTGVFSFLNGFERSQQEQQQQPQIIGPQIRRDKLRVQGFEAALPLVGIEEEESGGINSVYETAGMLSEMFNFPPGGVTTATELLENQISQSYRNTRSSPLAGAAASGDWFLNRQGMVVGGGLDPLVHSKNQTVVNDTAHHHHHHQQQQQQQISNINADSAAVMQLFLMNPQQQRSPSPSSSHPHPHPPPTSSTLHMLLPNPSPSSSSLHGFHSTAPSGPEGSFGQTAWVPNSGNETNPIEIPGLVEGQGLSLSLSSSLQHLEAAKAEELRMGGGGGMLYFGQGGGSAAPQYQFKNMTTPGGTGGGVFHLQSGVGHNHQLQVGLGSSIGALNMLRNSKYAKAAQELLDEFCSVGRGPFKKNKFSIKQNNNTNPSSNPPAGDTSGGAGGAGGGNSSSTSKDLPPLSASDRLEHQRRKVKLLSMLDEVDRRYNHYCDQMQMVVNSFDMVMGFGAAVSYTSLAQKAMSRHFRCLKEAVSAQLKHSCEVLGEKDAGSSGITKGETPRLRILEQSLRQQRAFHQMGMMEQEAWRPQRGLPERSVNILRAWLFEHFLHPYPSDADKHLLARQTGLSRNQVSNWFINARVRLWKPMVEDMYQEESKDGTQDQDQDQDETNNNAQTPTPNPTGKGTATTTTALETPTTTSSAITPPGKVSEFNALESDPSFITINDQCFSENQVKLQQNNNVPLPSVTILSSPSPSRQSFPVIHNPDTCRRGGPADYPTSHHPTNADINSTLIRFGASTGDVSLTLGLRHAGNLPEKRQFSVRDFGGC